MPPQPLFDVIFDAVSTTPDLYLACESYLQQNGVFVSTTGGFGGKASVSVVIGAARTFLQPSILGGVTRTHKLCHGQKDGRAQPVLEKLVMEGVDRGSALADI